MPPCPQDVKPENIMFDSEGANGVLKVLDFGSSAFVQPNEMVGVPYRGRTATAWTRGPWVARGASVFVQPNEMVGNDAVAE